jgi:hypothetical protein
MRSGVPTSGSSPMTSGIWPQATSPRAAATRLRWAATVPGTGGRAFQAEGQTLLPHYTLAVRVLAAALDAPIRVHPETYARRLHHLAPVLLNLPKPPLASWS